MWVELMEKLIDVECGWRPVNQCIKVLLKGCQHFMASMGGEELLRCSLSAEGGTAASGVKSKRESKAVMESSLVSVSLFVIDSDAGDASEKRAA